MERSASDNRRGALPLVIGMTSLVLVVPCLAAFGLRASGLVTSPVLLIVVPVIVSILVSHSISEIWKQRRAGSQLLFEDLMLWGWLRRRRFERLLARSEEFVGPDRGRGLSPQQRARELKRLAGALEARDPRTHGHSKRVARHATSIARKLNLGDDEVARIRTAALLHDIGKIEVPREILEKPAALTDDEFAEIKKHPAAGARLIESMGDPELVAIVRHHHERIDGGGYPDGLSQGRIPIGARIIAVADTFDALTSARSYRQPRSHEEALVVLREEAGTQLDARAVKAFDGRYSNQRPIALLAVLLGLGRQAGQSMISFGTGASQVAAVGAAAAVIAAPVVDKDLKQQPEKPAIVKQAKAAEVAAPVAAVSPGEESPVVVEASTGSRSGPRDKATAKQREAKNGAGKDGDEASPGSRSGPGEGDREDKDVSSPGNDRAVDDSTGGTGSGDGAAGGSGPGNNGNDSGNNGNGNGLGLGQGTAGKPVADVAREIGKSVREVARPVVAAVPSVPDQVPGSKKANEKLAEVKATLGKLTGKP